MTSLTRKEQCRASIHSELQFWHDLVRVIYKLTASVAVLALMLSSPMANAIEEPKYTVEHQYSGFEIRDYPAYLVAEVTVPGPADAAGNRGFRILADFIFGKNKGERKITMTAPVTQAPAGAKIKMTAPVVETDAGDSTFIVQFTMPAEYTLESLPEPIDPRVRIRQLPAARFAVIRYSGTWSERNYQEHLQKLERGVRAAGLRASGAPIYARYNAPFVPWFMRRNEIWIQLT